MDNVNLTLSRTNKRIRRYIKIIGEHKLDGITWKRLRKIEKELLASDIPIKGYIGKHPLFDIHGYEHMLRHTKDVDMRFAPVASKKCHPQYSRWYGEFIEEHLALLEVQSVIDW